MQYNKDILSALNGMLETEIEEAITSEDRTYNKKIRKIADNIPKEELAKIMGIKNPDEAHKVLNKQTWQISKDVKKRIENFKIEDLKEGQIEEALIQVFESEIESNVDPDDIRDDLNRALNEPDHTNPRFKVEIKPLEDDNKYHVVVYATIGNDFIKNALIKAANLEE